METKSVGILESKNDPFIADVILRLDGIAVELMSLADENIPLQYQYRVVVDRLSFCRPFLREIVKNLALSGTYIINNPFTASSTNKLVDIKLASRLGLDFPKTIVLPDKPVIEETDSPVIEPNLERVAEELGFPCVLKPFDGYGWQDVYVAKSAEELKNLYFALYQRHILVAQQLVHFKDYFRVFCFDKKDLLFIRWIPKPLSMGHYLYCEQNSISDVRNKLTDLTVQFNKALDLDVNVMEWCIDEQGRWWVIDAFNEVPDINPKALPAEYYSWIVDKFAACIMDKLDPGRKNPTQFG